MFTVDELKLLQVMITLNIKNYRDAASKYLYDTMPNSNYRKTVYEPTIQQMENLKTKIINLRKDQT
jgi:hypothetical protein